MNLSNEAVTVMKATTTGIVGWAKKELAALRSRIEKIDRKLADIGDPTAAIETLGVRVSELRESKESLQRVIEGLSGLSDLRGSQNNSLADDENIKSMKHQLSRHADHLRALQDRVRKLENER